MLYAPSISCTGVTFTVSEKWTCAICFVMNQNFRVNFCYADVSEFLDHNSVAPSQVGARREYSFWSFCLPGRWSGKTQSALCLPGRRIYWLGLLIVLRCRSACPTVPHWSNREAYWIVGGDLENEGTCTVTALAISRGKVLDCMLGYCINAKGTCAQELSWRAWSRREKGDRPSSVEAVLQPWVVDPRA